MTHRVDRYGISVSQMTTDMFHLSKILPGSILTHDITGFVPRLTRRVSLVEQELLTLPEHLSSSPFLVRFVFFVLSIIKYYIKNGITIT